MAVLRGGVLDAIRLESYSKVLAEEFDDDRDILTALDNLVRSAPAEFESKIPELGVLIALVKADRSTRLMRQRDEERRLAEAAEARDREEHPERYTTPQELARDFAAVAERVAAKAKAAKPELAPRTSLFSKEQEAVLSGWQSRIDEREVPHD